MIAEGLVPLRVPGLDFSGLGVLVAEGLSSRNTRLAHAKTLLAVSGRERFPFTFFRN